MLRHMHRDSFLYFIACMNFFLFFFIVVCFEDLLQLLCCNYTIYHENFVDYLLVLIFRRGLITRNVKGAVDLFHQRFGVSLS